MSLSTYALLLKGNTKKHHYSSRLHLLRALFAMYELLGHSVGFRFPDNRFLLLRYLPTLVRKQDLLIPGKEIFHLFSQSARYRFLFPQLYNM